MHRRARFLNLANAGAVACYDARWLTGLANNDLVSTWTDRSANAISLTATGTLRPTYNTATLAGQPVVTFASGEWIKTGSTTLLKNVSAGFAYCVATATGGDSYRTILALGTNNNLDRIAIYYRSSGNAEAGGRRLDSDGYQFVSATASGWNILGTEANYSAATLNLVVNGTRTARSGGFQASGSSSNTNSNGMSFGAFFTDHSVDRLVGSIAALSIFSAAPSGALVKRILHSYAFSFKLFCA